MKNYCSTMVKPEIQRKKNLPALGLIATAWRQEFRCAEGGRSSGVQKAAEDPVCRRNAVLPTVRGFVREIDFQFV